MPRPIAILGAPSSIGIRPYDDGRPRRLDLAPAALRARGLAGRLGARDHGDVLPPAYRDVARPPGRVRNEAGVAAYSRALAPAVAAAAADGAFCLLLGGDCSIVLGALLGLREAVGAAPGIVYVDAHADFATPTESRTGSAASMCLALAAGRGDTPLARLGDGPLLRAEDIAVIGRRDDAEPWYGQAALHALAGLDLTHREARRLGAGSAARAALAHVGRIPSGRFWIHVDADVLDPAVMPAVDSPEPDGLGIDELAALLGPLVRHPGALGLELTIYDPELDPGGVCSARLVSLLERVLGRAGADRRAREGSAAGGAP